MTAKDEATVKADIGEYDGELKLYRESPKNLDQSHLDFYRWLVLHGHMEKHGNSEKT